MYTVTYANPAADAAARIDALDKARMNAEMLAYKARIAQLDSELRASLGLPAMVS